jgi:biotin synthase
MVANATPIQVKPVKPQVPAAADSVSDPAIRHDWTTTEILALFDLPLMDLVHQAQTIHRQYNPGNSVQLATLLSVKTGGCQENCSYCAQSVHYDTPVEPEPVMDVATVLEQADRAKAAGATRFCMGWGWREIRDGKAFDQMLEMVQGVRGLGLEACVTAGMLNETQAQRLAAAGLNAYNHNLDTGPEYYDQIITTRTYGDRLNTLERVRKAGITLCTGGILGLGETVRDRARMLEVLATMTPHPESVPINALVAIEGTPLAQQQPLDPLDLVRMCAVTRILMPKARVRLSAGRQALSREAQVLCFLAGANSIFYGEKLLTVENPDLEADRQLLQDIGAVPLDPFAKA